MLKSLNFMHGFKRIKLLKFKIIKFIILKLFTILLLYSPTGTLFRIHFCHNEFLLC